MGGLTEDERDGRKKKKKPDYDLSDFVGASKYYYVDPSTRRQPAPEDEALLRILDRIGVAQDTGQPIGF